MTKDEIKNRISMGCPRYCFVFTYEYLSGGWSFYCIYADDLQTAQKQFESIPDELYFIKRLTEKTIAIAHTKKATNPKRGYLRHKVIFYVGGEKW